MPLTVLITLGPTREYIDPVRFISNASSGKMGKAIAQSALKKGCNVIVVKGQTFEPVKLSKKCKIIDVVTANDMFEAVKENLKFADIFIGAAAVSDYRPVAPSKNKIKKSSDTLILKLTKNQDIIRYVSEHRDRQAVIGFALETKKLLSYAKKKLKEKNLDMIVANNADAIASCKSSAQLIFKSGKIKKIEMTSKQNMAKEIINESIGIFKNNKSCKNGD